MTDLNLKLVVSGSNDGAIRALNQVVRNAQSAGTALDQADNRGSFGKTRAGVESISRQLANLQRLAAVALPANMLAGLAADAVRGVDQMKGVEARLRMASRSWQDYGVAMAGVRQIAFDSGTALAANVALVNRIEDPVRRMGGLQSDVLALTAAVNNSLRIQNAATSESASTMLQFAQAMSAGVLRGEELNSVLENAPRLARAIADGLDVTVGDLKNLGEQGALTSQQVFRALQTQQATLAAEAARLPKTVGQAWVNATEGVKVYLAELDKGGGVTGSFAAGLDAVAKNVPMIADGMGKIALLAGVAFGAKLVANITAAVTATRARIVADQLATQSAVRQAQADLAVQRAVAAKSVAELRAVAATQSYTLATNEAAAAAARRAAAERLVAANQGVAAASSALAIAKTAEAAANVGLLGRAMSGAAAAGRGLLGLFGGPIGLAVTAITAAALAWDFFSAKSREAKDAAGDSVDAILERFNEFSGKAGPAELAELLGELKAKAAELRDQLLDPGFRASEPGKQAAQDLKRLDKQIDESDRRAKQLKKELSELVAEKGLLGLGALKLGAGGLIDQDSMKALEAFDRLYKAFVQGATNENGQLKVSALETRAALDKLLSSAKTPAEFGGLIGRLGDLLAATPKSGTLRSQLETAIEGRMQAEMRALDGLVAGLEQRAERTRGLFAAATGTMLSQFNQAAALARVVAELRDDGRSASSIDVGLRNAGTSVAVQQAQLEMRAVEQTAARKRQIVAEDLAATKASADADIAAAQRVMDTKLATFQQQVDAGKKTEAQLMDYRADLQRQFLTQTAGAVAARGQAEADGARKIRQIDAESARERAAVAQQLYQTIQSKAQEALAQYKSYASQVMALDKAISTNRLDTMAAIGQLARQNMSPTEQIGSLRAELAALKRETAAALGAGQRDYALELLGRQKSLASQIGSARGDGIDPQQQAEEGIAALRQIGGQADAILQAQRSAAAAAAAEQLASYQQMVQAMNSLAQQITTLNQQATVKLKPEIDQASLAGAIAAVQAAFDAAKIRVQVAASAAASGDLPGRAYGGELPGFSAHDRADNNLYWGTAGEFVVQRPIVRQPQALAFLHDFNLHGMAALAKWRLPGFAFGGEIGQPSLINRLQVPSAPTAALASGVGEPDVLDMGALGNVRVRKTAHTAADVARVMQRAALQYGRD